MAPDADETTYRGPEIPDRLGERLRIAMGLEERPGTFGDWVEAMGTIADRDGIDVDLDALCTTDASPHRASFDGRAQHYQCTQDALVVPFLAADVDRVDIETESPVRGEPIEIVVTGGDVVAEPPTTVLSFGVAADVEEPPADVASPILAYERICPYGHAFADRGEYEAWAAGVDAVTMPVSVEDTVAFARAIGDLA